MRHAPESDQFKPPREAASLVRFVGLVIDLDACMLARKSGEAIPLTRSEFALLRMFVTRPGRVLSRDTLLDALTNRRFEPFDRSVDVANWEVAPQDRAKTEATLPHRDGAGRGLPVQRADGGLDTRQGSTMTGLTSQNESGPRAQFGGGRRETDAAGGPCPRAHARDDRGPIGDATNAPTFKPRFGFIAFVAAIASLLLLVAGSGW